MPDLTYNFSDAVWIWDGSDRFGYHHYVDVRHDFELTAAELAMPTTSGAPQLAITADAHYQLSLNGRVIGHGPAKSAAGKRSVDVYDVTAFLQPGQNTLEVLALSVGVGTMTYCLGAAGVIFQLDVGDRVAAASGPQTRVRPSPSRQSATVRRWILPCIEDVDANAEVASEDSWQPATVVDTNLELYTRRVPLPSRQPMVPGRVIIADTVQLPNVRMALRLRHHFVSNDEHETCNLYQCNAIIIADLISPRAQSLHVLPALANVTWYLNEAHVIDCSGWNRVDVEDGFVAVPLAAGANRLIGHLTFSHFEDISFVARCDENVEWRNPFGDGQLQLATTDDADIDVVALTSATTLPANLRSLAVSPNDVMPDGNSQDVALNCTHLSSNRANIGHHSLSAAAIGLPIPAAPAGQANRIVVDLQTLSSAWLSFAATGRAGGKFTFSFFEEVEETIPRELKWAKGCNNGFCYRLRDGHQQFESFFAYGARYVSILYEGDAPVHLHTLSAYSANCGSARQGYFLTSDSQLNDIYRCCVNAVIGGSDDTFTDGPTPEQAAWNFDNRMAAFADHLCVGNDAVARNSLLLFTEDEAYPGLKRCLYPGAWDMRIPLWSFHWILWCADYYDFTGDMDTLRQVFPHIEAGIEEALGKMDDDGLLKCTGDWHFVEWSPERDDGHDYNCAEQAGLVGALAAAERLARELGDVERDTIERWHVARASLIGTINNTFWSDADKCYIDSVHDDGTLSPYTTVTTNAICCAFGIARPIRRKMLARRIRLQEPSLLPTSNPYGLYYVLEMFDLEGDARTILELIRQRWGNNSTRRAAVTADTFPASGFAHNPRSRQHPVSAFIVKYLVKYLMGIHRLKPGFAEFRVRPEPAELAFCHGAIPTPRGLIRVHWRREHNNIDIEVEHPATITRVRSSQASSSD